MASARAMKRAQGDPLLAAAQSAFGGGSDVSDESSSEDEGARASSKPLNAFALLGGDDDDDDDTPEESEEEPEPPPVVKEPTPPPASKKKKKKKKKKTKAADDDEADEALIGDDDDGMAEITAALKEIGETMPAPRPERDALSADASVSGRDALMCVDTRRLKAEDELRSIFGASVIRAVETEDGGNANANANALGHIGRNPRAPGKGGKMQAKLTNARSMLVTPKDGWPPYRAKGTGLAMECVDAAGSVKTFRIVRTDDFADADAAYKRAVASHDPNNLHDSCGTGRGTSTRSRRSPTCTTTPVRGPRARSCWSGAFTPWRARGIRGSRSASPTAPRAWTHAS